MTPHDSTSRNNATSTANNAGCVYPVVSRRAASSLPSSANNTSRKGRSSCGSSNDSTSSSAPANTGKRAYSSRPIPTRCDP